MAHAIYFYKKLGKRYNPDQVELFPMVVERLYLSENITSSLYSFCSDLDSAINDKSIASYNDPLQIVLFDFFIFRFFYL